MNINTALGMIDQPRPFVVGDWVELIEGKGDGQWHLEHATWPQRIVKFDSLGNVCFDNSGPWCEFRFRHATPPDDAGTLREQLAESERRRDSYERAFTRALSFVDQAFQPRNKSEAILPDFCRFGGDKFEAVPRLAKEYKRQGEQLADVTKERDEARASASKWEIACAETHALVESHEAHIERITKERDEARKQLELADCRIITLEKSDVLCQKHLDELGVQKQASEGGDFLEVPPRLQRLGRERDDWRDTANAIYQAVPEAYQLGQTPEYAKRKPSETVREVVAQLRDNRAAAEADAAEIAAKDVRIAELEKLLESRTQDVLDATFDRVFREPDAIGDASNVAAKDAEIEELESKLTRNDGHYSRLDAYALRLTRKARTAKAALVATYRGQIDPAWFGEKPVAPGPIYWRLKDVTSSQRNGFADWLLKNGTMYISDEDGDWESLPNSTPSQFDNDPECERCNADGSPLTHADTGKVDDAAMCGKLREWTKNAVFSVVGNSLVIGCQCVPTEFAELLIAIRDGGAK